MRVSRAMRGLMPFPKGWLVTKSRWTPGPERGAVSRTILGVDRCEQCGFSYDETAASQAASAILAGVGELDGLLATASPLLGRRRQSETWSALEYCCHVRDVLLVQRERVLAARREQRPVFDPMGRDERVEHDGYAEQEPADVRRQLADAARLFSNVLRRLGPTDWERRVVYPYPEPIERSLRWLAVHTQHEVEHHLLDVRRQALAESEPTESIPPSAGSP